MPDQVGDSHNFDLVRRSIESAKKAIKKYKSHTEKIEYEPPVKTEHQKKHGIKSLLGIRGSKLFSKDTVKRQLEGRIGVDDL